jgi:hypothetical protein
MYSPHFYSHTLPTSSTTPTPTPSLSLWMSGGSNQSACSVKITREDNGAKDTAVHENQKEPAMLAVIEQTKACCLGCLLSREKNKSIPLLRKPQYAVTAAHSSKQLPPQSLLLQQVLQLPPLLQQERQQVVVVVVVQQAQEWLLLVLQQVVAVVVVVVVQQE